MPGIGCHRGVKPGAARVSNRGVPGVPKPGVRQGVPGVSPGVFLGYQNRGIPGVPGGWFLGVFSGVPGADLEVPPGGARGRFWALGGTAVVSLEMGTLAARDPWSSHPRSAPRLGPRLVGGISGIPCFQGVPGGGFGGVLGVGFGGVLGVVFQGSARGSNRGIQGWFLGVLEGCPGGGSWGTPGEACSRGGILGVVLGTPENPENP